jgi:putative thioredoxin
MSEATSPWVVDVAEADFQRDVLEASRGRPVVVDFWAPWCQPCLLLGPLLERLVAERRGEVVLARVNVDEAPALAQHFGIASIPAVKAFRDGRPVLEFEGLLPEAHLRAFLDQVGPGEADRLAGRARALEAARPAEAERLYRQALGQEPNDASARVGLARVLLGQDRTDEVEALLEPVGSEGELGAEAERLKARLFLRRAAGGLGEEAALRRRLAGEPDNAALRYELGCVLAARGDYPAALEALLAAGERDPGLAAGKVREAMVKVFYALGADHPLANDYRARLARLLY